MLHIPVISVFLLLLHFPDLSKQQDPVQCKPVDTEPTCVCQLDDGQYISLLGIANENRKPRLAIFVLYCERQHACYCNASTL